MIFLDLWLVSWSWRRIFCRVYLIRCITERCWRTHHSSYQTSIKLQCKL